MQYSAGIRSLQHGFAALGRVPGGMAAVSEHTFRLARYAVTRLRALRHSCGAAAVTLYGFTEDIRQQGGIVNFNLLSSEGEVVGFSALKTLCDMRNIVLR